MRKIGAARKKIKSLRWIPLIAVGLSLSGLSTSCRHFNRQVSCAVLAIEGEAQLVSGRETSRLTNDSWIQTGEKIATAPGGRVDLMLLPGILIEMMGGAEIQLEELHLERDGDETIHPMRKREGRIQLFRGALCVVIGQTQIPSRLRIETAAGTLAAGSDRTFQIEVKENKTLVMCIRGNTTFEAAQTGARIKIAPGYFAVWPSAVVAPQAVVQAGGGRQAEFRQILIAEKRLRRLGKERPSAFALEREAADQK